MQAHVLIVEDDPKMLQALSYRLHYAGYTVTQASSGEVAVNLLEENVFDVVLTDIVMGDVDGIEILYTARMQAYHPAVILLTGHGTLDTSLAALRAGAHDYLMKPCPDDVLLACVERAVQHRLHQQQLLGFVEQHVATCQADAAGEETAECSITTSEHLEHMHKEPPIQIGTLSIGASRKDVVLDGQPIPLTPVEYALVHYLAESPGVVHTCSDMVRRTHGFEMSEADAHQFLKAHMRHVRKKVGASIVVYVDECGYKLEEPGE